MIKNISASFICSDSKVYHPNSVNTNAARNFNPTIGNFGQFSNRSFAAEYSYSFDKELSTYRYKNANPVPGPIPRIDIG
jgi:hypothetical protein